MVSAELVSVHLAAPESLPAEAHVPVAQVVADKLLDEPAGEGDVIVFVSRTHLLDEGVEKGNDPPVKLRTLRIRNGCACRVKSVNIGIKGEE